MSDVLVIGPVSWNHTVFLDALPPPVSHTVGAVRHHVGLGGTSAGKALNLRSAGVPVTLRTVVGRDDEADRILATLGAAEVRVLAEMAANGRSERHLNLMDAHGQRVSIYLEPAVTAVAEPMHAEATSKALRDAAAVVIDISDSTRPLLAEAKALGRPIWCDLHDYDGASTWHRDFVEAADYLFLNDDALGEIELFMRRQLAAGKRLVVVTRGARGAWAMAADGRLRTVAAEPVAEVVDTNGAGDAFLAGFLAAHLTGADIDECLERAAHHAALCVQSPGLAPPVATSDA